MGQQHTCCRQLLTDPLYSNGMWTCPYLYSSLLHLQSTHLDWVNQWCQSMTKRQNAEANLYVYCWQGEVLLALCKAELTLWRCLGKRTALRHWINKDRVCMWCAHHANSLHLNFHELFKHADAVHFGDSRITHIFISPTYLTLLFFKGTLLPSPAPTQPAGIILSLQAG